MDMADETPAGNGTATAPTSIKMQVLAQYVRDLSFENLVVQKGLSAGEMQPDIQVAVSLDARKRPVANQYEVVTKFKVTSKNKVNGDTLFLLELEYGGTFLIEGVADDQLHPVPADRMPAPAVPLCAPHHLGRDARRRVPTLERRSGGFHGAVSVRTGAARSGPAGCPRRKGQLGLTLSSRWPHRPALRPSPHALMPHRA
jgi:preprotein translocase subunit SecB